MQLQLVPSWKRIPFLRIIIPFIAGIACQNYTSTHPYTGGTLAIICLIAIILYSFADIPLQYRLRRINGLVVNILLFAFGMLCIYSKDVKTNTTWIGHHAKMVNILRVRINAELSEKQSTYKTEGTIISDSLKGRLLLYFRKDSLRPKVETGDHIFIRNVAELIPSNHNPGGFNYQRYCGLKQVYHQAFLKNNDYKLSGYNDAKALEKLILFLQKNVLNTFRKNIPSSEIGLAEALLIGYKEDLDRDLLQRYSNTGVVHVIAISGLHLALVYLIIEKLLSVLFKKKSWAKALLVILCLWIFTLLAGASPSVVRSAAMFSIIVWGESFQKRSNILNSLFASAFLLLSYDPYWLWDLGFQLSYTAVLGLVLFAKPAYDLLYIPNKLLDKLWKMCSVTLAAQLLTLPIILYNFHQFPVYFVFTNMICVPLSSLILMLEILLCAVSAINPFASILGTSISWLIGLMNQTVDFFSELPLSVIYPLRISEIQSWLMFGAITCFYFYKKYSIKLLFNAGLVCIWLIFLAHIQWQRIVARQNMVIIYNAGKTRAMDIIYGDETIMIADSAVIDGNNFKRYIEPSRTLFGIRKHSLVLYPGRMADVKINQVGLALMSKQIIIQGIDGKKKIVQWKSAVERVSEDYYFIGTEGAFVKSFN